MESEEKLLSIREVAAILNVHKDTVRSYIESKYLPAIILPGAVRIRPADLQEFLNKRKTPTM